MFASLPGVSAPPPFGGNQRTVVVRVDPDRLRSYQHVARRRRSRPSTAGNTISPSGNVRIGDEMPIVPVNSLVKQVEELETIPLRPGRTPTVYLRDVATVEDATDIPTGYALVNGRRAVYILVTKRADASTLSVVNAVKANLPQMQAVLPDDINVSFEFDQSPYVTGAMRGVGDRRGCWAPCLTGLMVLLFLRDWRSVIVVVLNIPLRPAAASVVALWLTGQTINLMTLGGLALAVGILVDEATVEVENIHTQMEHDRLGRPRRPAGQHARRPCRGCWRCSASWRCSSRRSSCRGRPAALFVPLSLAVGFAMVTSYLLSSTFVPVLSVWLLRHHHHAARTASPRRSPSTGSATPTAGRCGRLVRWRWAGRAGLPRRPRLLIARRSAGGSAWRSSPTVDAGQFQLRVRGPAGTPHRGDRGARPGRRWTRSPTGRSARTTSPSRVGYVGTGPVQLPDQRHLPVDRRARGGGPPRRPEARTAASASRTFEEPRCASSCRKMRAASGRRPMPGRAALVRAGRHRQRGDELRLADAGRGRRQRPEPRRQPRLRREGPRASWPKVPSLRDLQYGQSLDYPTVERRDRPRAGRPERRDGRGRRPLAGRGHLVEPLRRAQLLARPQDRHRLPGAGRDPATSAMDSVERGRD